MRHWKNMLLLAVVFLVLAALLEGGARLLSWAFGREVLPIAFITSEGQEKVVATESGPNSGDLHTIHTPDQWVWWRVKPNLSGYLVKLRWEGAEHFELNTDRHGFRATGASPSDASRILVVGDSTAFGVGVDDPDTWPALLKEHVGGEVLNTGVPGYSTFQALRMAEKYGLAPLPELVVVCAGFNDTSLTPKGELPDHARALKNEREQGSAGAKSYFLELLEKAVAGGSSNDESRVRLTIDEYRQTLVAAEHDMAARGIGLLWVRWPTRDEVEHGLPASGGYPQALLEHCEQPGVRCVDLLEPFKAMAVSPYFDFVHVTKQGNATAAKSIAAALTSSVD